MFTRSFLNVLWVKTNYSEPSQKMAESEVCSLVRWEADERGKWRASRQEEERWVSVKHRITLGNDG